MTPARAGEQFTALAETLLQHLFTAVCAEFEKRHGIVPGGRAALLAFGKMASREMTATSDLDFILLYDVEGGAEESNGERPLATSHYYTRLTQRVVAAVTAPTTEGVLYAADMRLRPSGNAGPLATSLPAFVSYHHAEAWTWEHLALSRARLVVADNWLGSRIEAAIEDVLSRPRDATKTIDDVVSMRERMARDRTPRHPFDLKLAAGGLVDLEFIAQSAQLVARAELAMPQGTTAATLARMGEVGLLPEAERLVAIHATYSTVLQVMSAALADPFKDDGWTGAFRELLARQTNTPTFERLVEDLREMQGEVSTAAAGWYARARLMPGA
jgi:glutamate-ammonia-ligase adenylyltransferase